MRLTRIVVQQEFTHMSDELEIKLVESFQDIDLTMEQIEKIRDFLSDFAVDKQMEGIHSTYMD